MRRLLQYAWWAAAAGYRGLYDAGVLRPERIAGVRVVSVGNLAVGGRGKTPLCRWLVTEAMRRGHKAAYVGRPYRAPRAAGAAIVSHGDGPAVPWQVCGDEAFETAVLLRGTGAVVIAARDKVAGVRLAAEAGCSVAVVDDGLQTARLERDADVVLVHPRDGAVSAGWMREPRAALHRADVVVGWEDAWAESGADRRPQVLVRATAVGWRNAAWRSVDAPDGPALAFIGTGDPDRVHRTLAGCTRVVDAIYWGDHRPVSRRAWRRVVDRARRCGASWVATTTKDLVRIPGGGDPVFGLEVAVRPVVGTERLLAVLDPGSSQYGEGANR